MKKSPITDSVLRWFKTFLAERFGHAWHLAHTPEGLSLSLQGAEGAIVFDVLQDSSTDSRFDLPFTQWNAEHEGWESVLGRSLPAPGVANLSVPLIEQRGLEHFIHYDIPGLVLWMLARGEEIGCTDLDNHGRFPSTSSHAYRHGYIDRPVVDEWLHILGQVIQRQWPSVELRRHRPKIFVTCDVDCAYYVNYSGKAMARGLAGDLLKRCNPRLAVGNLHKRVRALCDNFTGDPYLDNIEWIMDVNEQEGNRVAFYFIVDGNHPLDARYRMDEPVIRRLLRRIHDRGHEIGLHPSYNTYKNPQQTIREAGILRRTLSSEGIPCSELGGRQHYLRWQTSQTARNWEDAGMRYDSTLFYADRPGFRCGTSREYNFFDLIENRPLKIRQRPLILMESSVFAEQYLGMGYTEDTLAYMLELKRRALSIGGEFTLLWHNSSFNVPEDRAFYRELIRN